MLQTGTVIASCPEAETIIQNAGSFVPTHGTEGSLIEISGFAGDAQEETFTGQHQGTAYYFTTDNNTALPTEILVQGKEDFCMFLFENFQSKTNEYLFSFAAPDGLTADLITNYTVYIAD